MLDRLAINTAAQVLEIWSYIHCQIDCVDLPILRALIAEHRDFLMTISDAKAPEVLRLSITIEALSTEKILYGSELVALRDEIFCVVTRIKDGWVAFLSWPDMASLLKLRVAMANYDDILCDLETQQRLRVEDAIIHVKVKRKRSPSPGASHKQRNDWQQPASEQFRPPLKRQDCRDEIFRGLVAMTFPQRKRINHIMQPAAGELYLVNDTKSRCWLVALVLPHTNLHDVGIPGTLESLGLLKRIPTSISFNAKTQRFEWRTGGENGRPFACIQMFPVAYFASIRFPDSRAMGWVRADQLRAFDASCVNPSSIPYYALVRSFLERRIASRTRTSWIEPTSPEHSVEHNGQRSNDWNTPTKNETTEAHVSAARANSRQQFRVTRSGSFLCAVSPGRKSSGVHHTSDKSLVPASTANPTVPRRTYSKGEVGYASPMCSPCPIDTPVFNVDSKSPKLKTVSLPSLQSTFKGAPGARFGLFKWPELAEPSERVLYKLSGMSKIKGVKPLPRDFLDSEGLLCCPLCPDTKQFGHLSLFTEHLLAQH
ncbi:uncharacterized protein FPRO_07139 [Fusarium proliferatum ET1]|uniref:Uncharacterized protein n=1 Tax=Fusarium proliferatum (strain ET1) TaxID=1227346 RepID=A0A1L7VE14_FUSPR|nr:uncharacterized protein FPRO_07139 [Fusarium proliferatum ET1]CZR37670.1 uncharacterized protein FPRO_07139 [Fusarium proliferatum ET1]